MNTMTNTTRHINIDREVYRFHESMVCELLTPQKPAGQFRLAIRLMEGRGYLKAGEDFLLVYGEQARRKEGAGRQPENAYIFTDAGLLKVAGRTRNPKAMPRALAALR